MVEFTVVSVIPQANILNEMDCTFCVFPRISTLDPRLSREELKALWKAVDPGNAGVVEVQAIHNLLSGNFGVDKVTQRSAGVIERVIKKILERCGENAGIKGLQR